MVNYENILYEKKGRVAVVTLNRPENLNGVSVGISTDIVDAFHEMEGDDEVLCTVFTGAGRAFCAGAFIRDPKTHDLTSVGQAMHRGGGRGQSTTGWVRAMDEYSKPLIAAVNGHAYGAGLNMALMSDIVIASTEARFCFPMTRIGIIPGVSGGPRLVLRVGLSKALEMSVMARAIDGEDAYRWGLANKVVPPDQLLPEAMAWAEEIAGLAPISTKLAKEDIRESWLHHIHESASGLRMRFSMLTEDRKEGHNAWREKRVPIFKGR